MINFCIFFMKKKYAQYLLQKTKVDYNLIAKDFSRTRGVPWPEFRFLFSNYLTKKDRVLDLGCGNGRYYPFFKKRNVDYFGVDNCRELIEIAKERYSEADFKIEDALNLSFPDDFFDKVYSIALLHQIPSEELRLQFLKEIKRVLNIRGYVVLTVWKFHRFEELISLFKYTILKLIGKSDLDWKDVFIPWGKRIQRYYHYFSARELKNLVKRAGFKILKSGTIKSIRKNRQNIYIVALKP
jgi:tRNA (uracil-5-)-methyltransferase TRM9